MSVLRRWFSCCRFIVWCTSHCLWESVFVFVLLCITISSFYFCNHLEEKDGCFVFIVLQMYCFFTCSVTLPHGAVGWSVVMIWYFLIKLTYFVYGTKNHFTNKTFTQWEQQHTLYKQQHNYSLETDVIQGQRDWALVNFTYLRIALLPTVVKHRSIIVVLA